MFKDVKVSLPKKRKLVKDMRVVGLLEPVRKTMYDIVLENFKTAQRSTFIHRIIYIGEHTFPKNSHDMGGYFFDTISNANQASIVSETITGILIQYARHFIHMIEGDEDCIMLHLKLLFENQKELKNLSNLKLLLQINHVNQRLLLDWSFYHATPAKLLEKIESDSPIEETSRQILKCIEKMYKLIHTMASTNVVLASNESAEEILSVVESTIQESNILFMRSSLDAGPANNLDNYRKEVPELERIDYILKSGYPLDLKQYLSIISVIPQRNIQKDLIWPVPADLIPYDILFPSLYNLKTEFPKSSNEKVVEAKEEDEFVVEDIGTELIGSTP